MGVPPALPGRQQKFDISGGRLRRAIDETPNREPPSTRRGVPSMDDYESLSHSKWECKYHVIFIPKCRRKTLYVELRRHLGEVFRKLAEVCGVAGGRVHQGQERDPSRPCLRGEEAQLRWAALLGQRVLRQHGGAGRRGDTHLHPQPGEGGSEVGSTQPLAIAPLGGSNLWGRVSDRQLPPRAAPVVCPACS